MGKVTIAPVGQSTQVKLEQAEVELLNNYPVEIVERVIEKTIFLEAPAPQIIEQIVENKYDDTELRNEIKEIALKASDSMLSIRSDIARDQNDLEDQLCAKIDEQQENIKRLIEECELKHVMKINELTDKVNEIDQRKVTEIIRIKPQTPKGLLYLSLFTLIIALMGLFT